MPFEITSDLFVVRANVKEAQTLSSYFKNKKFPLKELNGKIKDVVYDCDVDLSAPGNPNYEGFSISDLFIFLSDDIDLIRFVSTNEDKINEETVADVYYIKWSDKKMPQITKLCFSAGRVHSCSIGLEKIDKDALMNILGKEYFEKIKNGGNFYFFEKLPLRKIDKLLEWQFR